MSAGAPGTSNLVSALRALGPSDGVTVRDASAFLSLVEAPTGRSFGLKWSPEGDQNSFGWAYLAGEAVVSCDAEAVAGGERRFMELLERPRREVEDALDAAATRLSLDVGEVLRTLPSVTWVSAVLASRHDHLCRLALAWLLPSELREAREAIVTVAEDDTLQIGVRQLAERLVVPEEDP